MEMSFLAWHVSEGEFHAGCLDVVDQRLEPLWIFGFIDLPISKCSTIILPTPEPAIVQNKSFGPDFCSQIYESEECL